LNKSEPEWSSVGEVLKAYKKGRRDFWRAQLDSADFSGRKLEGVSFMGSSLRQANFDGARLTHVQLKSANLTGASLVGASINASDLIGANFTRANLDKADLTGASLNCANLTEASMVGVNLGNTVFDQTNLSRARLDKADLWTHLIDLDLGALCDAKKLRHSGPSGIDARSIMKSYYHPRLRSFMLKCGVPALFVEYQIECARALGDSILESLMQSTFISYGGPDERFARRLYDALSVNGVTTFFFPENSVVGERISNEVYRNIQSHDRTILVCSKSSLNRSGVLHEIQETFDREARDGGATYLLPIMLDDYVLTDWKNEQPQYAQIIGSRVVADFRKTARNKQAFELAVGRLMSALKKRQVTG
jgi:hypothetical protein